MGVSAGCIGVQICFPFLFSVLYYSYNAKRYFCVQRGEFLRAAFSVSKIPHTSITSATSSSRKTFRKSRYAATGGPPCHLFFVFIFFLYISVANKLDCKKALLPFGENHVPVFDMNYRSSDVIGMRSLASS